MTEVYPYVRIKLNMLKRLILASLVFLLAIFPYLHLRSDVQAATLTSMTDTMTRLKISVVANHTIVFTTPTGVTDTETITITFPAAFNTASIVEDDVDVADDGTDLTTAADCTGSEHAGVAMAGDVLTISLCSGDGGAIAATSVVTVEIGTNATASGTGVNQITNPGSSGSNTIAIAGTMTDSGSLAVPIMTDDQVTVSATVDPTITSLLSSSTCLLGILDNTSINFCSYNNNVTTNASSGYSSTILDDGNLRSSGGDDINDETGDSDVDEGTEEYGVSSDDTTGTQAIIDSTGCDDSGTFEAASAITTDAQEYADNTGPVDAEITTLCHSASVLGTTPAGSYSHLTTHITTGTF